jgi:transketolase
MRVIRILNQELSESQYHKEIQEICQEKLNPMISRLIQAWENENTVSALSREIDRAQKRMRELFAARILPEVILEACKSERKAALENSAQLASQTMQEIRMKVQMKAKERWMTPRAPVLDAVKTLLKTSEILEALIFKES